jgi:hypothetical protein
MERRSVAEPPSNLLLTTNPSAHTFDPSEKRNNGVDTRKPMRVLDVMDFWTGCSDALPRPMMRAKERHGRAGPRSLES